ncbi:MAG: hypothetical protein KC643_12830 [Nitrospira sp.]|nr:hypothetical protein [Nitrospira sp.]MCA9498863.1 hypothetical protein [Nitrospira sp.]
MTKRTENQIIFTATKEQLTCSSCYDHLWSMAVSLAHLSSAGWITAIEEFFRDTDILGIEIRQPNGELFKIPYIFDVFPDENEAGRRWVTNFRQADETGMRPRSMCRCLLKLQFIELYVHATVAKYTRGPDTPRCSLTHFPLGF